MDISHDYRPQEACTNERVGRRNTTRGIIGVEFHPVESEMSRLSCEIDS